MFQNGTYLPFDPDKITEYHDQSWYIGNSPNRPLESMPEPDMEKPNAYSWVKAPRYDGLPFEVGPLARLWISGNYQNGISTMDRTLARALEVNYVCLHNRCRSQMTEAFTRQISRGMVRVESAGLHPLPVHPLTIDVMKVVGIDITENKSKSIDIRAYSSSNIIFRIRDQSNEKSPIVPFAFQIYNEHWNIINPMTDGNAKPDIQDFRKIRNEVQKEVEILLNSFVRMYNLI